MAAWFVRAHTESGVPFILLLLLGAQRSWVLQDRKLHSLPKSHEGKLPLLFQELCWNLAQKSLPSFRAVLKGGQGFHCSVQQPREGAKGAWRNRGECEIGKLSEAWD